MLRCQWHHHLAFFSTWRMFRWRAKFLLSPIFFPPSWSDRETGRSETRIGHSDTVNNVEISKQCFFQVSRYERRVNYPWRLNSRGERKWEKKEKIMHIYESSSMVLGSLQAVSSRQRLRVISTSLPLFHSSLKPSFHPPHQTASFSESRHLDSKRIKCIFSPEPRVRLLSSPKGSHIRPTTRFPFSHRLISHLSILPNSSPQHPPCKWTFSSWGWLATVALEMDFE